MIQTKLFSIIVPTFDEAASVRRVISDIIQYYPQADVVVVDDGSTDHTIQQLDGFVVKIVRHPFNMGYGAAIKSGLKNSKHDIIVTVDADGQHAIRDIDKLMEEMIGCGMVVGKRVGSVPTKFMNRIGKAVLWIIASFAFGHSIPDINSGFRIFKKNILEKYILFLPDTFSFHASSTLLLLFNGHSIKYVSTKISPRSGSSKVFFISGLKSVLALMKLERMLLPQRFFLLHIFVLTLVAVPVLFIYCKRDSVIVFSSLWCLLIILAERLTKNRKNDGLILIR